MNDKELKKFAARISSQLFMMYEELCDAWVDAHGEKESLFTDEAQAHLYGHVAGAARAFNISPLYWKKYRKGQMTTRQAYSAIARLFNDEWWISQLKGQRMRWHEALLIAVGEVNKDRSPYASKHAIRDVRARRQANLEFLKSCDLENRETGERIDLISKVMGSISNPEIRRMELMNTIAGIERYRELRKLPRGVSIADEFDERVEAARAAADSGDFALYISAQGGANVPRDCQTVRVARSPSDDVNEYEEEVERVVGIYAPHLGARHIHITRTTDWRIVPKVPVVEPLTLKSGIAAPRSPVNNCGKLTGGDTSLPAPTPSVHAAAVLNLVDDGVIEWNDPEVVRALRGALKHGLRRPNRQQRNGSPLKPHEIAPSARLTRSERMQITRIRVDLAQNGIRPQRWELEALARGATVDYNGKKFTYPVADEWSWFYCYSEQ
ncbi:TPA: replication endonuclease [Escherichia coli]|nr:replication endonuclease [Escherichia coli]